MVVVPKWRRRMLVALNNIGFEAVGRNRWTRKGIIVRFAKKSDTALTLHVAPRGANVFDYNKLQIVGSISREGDECDHGNYSFSFRDIQEEILEAYDLTDQCVS